MILAIPLLLADTPTHDLSIFDPASPPAESIRDLSILVLAITGFIFVVVEGVLIYSHRPLPAPRPRPATASRRRSTAASRSRSPGPRRRP